MQKNTYPLICDNSLYHLYEIAKLWQQSIESCQLYYQFCLGGTRINKRKNGEHELC